ncbi:aminotransferase class I/II-fold pyridoxal phosphate-dependent enzyme [Candidatus Pelagibacter sp.]|nr:aminotransferase class I/II-fold pyridoxal phosphate-dependent enzyme [Candidatus Pelagibacter sp.]
MKLKKINNKKGWRFNTLELNNVKKVLDTDFSSGSDKSMTEKFEKEFAKIHKQEFAIASNSGTSTLHQALHAIGVGHGHEVIIPALTVAMCGFAVWQCGAVPVYADVDKDTFLIDPEDIQKKITKKTKAIMVVHLYGLMCDMDKILKIAKKNNIKVLEDCAQCFLGLDNKKRVSGTVGDIGSWSLESSKHISCGEGGILTTNNSVLAKKMRKFGGLGFTNITATSGKIRIDKNKFQDPSWRRHDELGFNYRMSEVSSAIAYAQTKKLSFFVKKRIESGNAYRNLINNSKTNILYNQKVSKGYIHSYYTFPVLFNSSLGFTWSEFRKKYIENGGDGIYAAWQTVNNEPVFKNLINRGLYSGNMLLSNSYGWGKTPNAIKIQKNIMQFTTNQMNRVEISKQLKALNKTLRYFEK